MEGSSNRSSRLRCCSSTGRHRSRCAPGGRLRLIASGRLARRTRQARSSSRAGAVGAPARGDRIDPGAGSGRGGSCGSVDPRNSGRPGLGGHEAARATQPRTRRTAATDRNAIAATGTSRPEAGEMRLEVQANTRVPYARSSSAPIWRPPCPDRANVLYLVVRDVDAARDALVSGGGRQRGVSREGAGRSLPAGNPRACRRPLRRTTRPTGRSRRSVTRTATAGRIDAGGGTRTPDTRIMIPAPWLCRAENRGLGDTRGDRSARARSVIGSWCAGAARRMRAARRRDDSATRR